MIIALIIIAVLILAIVLYFRQPQFGKTASGERLERILQSPNYRDGKFHNVSTTPQLAEGYTLGGVMFRFLFKKGPRRVPVDAIPSVKTDLLNLRANENVLVWFGHSSYFMQIDGKRFLVDPVFSGNASPLPGTNKAFKGADIYAVGDMPQIDYLFLTHDHYDHLDYKTIKALKNKVSKVVCGLGVGEHMEHWGYAKNSIIEKDRDEQFELEPGFTVTTAPARHFSGRGFSRNKTLWLSFILKTPTMNLYLGGDSGYDTHFAEIGNKYGPFDLVILENGQYNLAWPYIHALPDEILKAAQELKAKRLLPVHFGKFAMADHPWDEPIAKVAAFNKDYNIPLATPMIGEIVRLNDLHQPFKQWWAGLQ